MDKTYEIHKELNPMKISTYTISIPCFVPTKFFEHEWMDRLLLFLVYIGYKLNLISMQLY